QSHKYVPGMRVGVKEPCNAHHIIIHEPRHQTSQPHTEPCAFSQSSSNNSRILVFSASKARRIVFQMHNNQILFLLLTQSYLPPVNCYVRHRRFDTMPKDLPTHRLDG